MCLGNETPQRSPRNRPTPCAADSNQHTSVIAVDGFPVTVPLRSLNIAGPSTAPASITSATMSAASNIECESPTQRNGPSRQPTPADPHAVPKPLGPQQCRWQPGRGCRSPGPSRSRNVKRTVHLFVNPTNQS